MKERVRNAGGHITITPDGGFMIVCILPREEDSAIAGGVEAGVVEMLVVDDEALIRDSLKVLLELEDDFEVIGTAADGREA